MENELVRYSRAGDEFHYRWAARRAIKLIDPRSPSILLIIEGSKESKLAGEYVIDVAEYLGTDIDNINEIIYYQLKHTTKRKDDSFKLSDLKNTIEGFALRFNEHYSNANTLNNKKITFSIITNRPIDANFKKNISAIANCDNANSRFQITLEKYTKLQSDALRKFCSQLVLVDGEGDYNDQRYQLHLELVQLVAGTVDNPQINNIISLVKEKALPDSDGKIVQEEILQRFGVTSERELFQLRHILSLFIVLSLENNTLNYLNKYKTVHLQ